MTFLDYWRDIAAALGLGAWLGFLLLYSLPQQRWPCVV